MRGGQHAVCFLLGEVQGAYLLCLLAMLLLCDAPLSGCLLPQRLPDLGELQLMLRIASLACPLLGLQLGCQPVPQMGSCVKAVERRGGCEPLCVCCCYRCSNMSAASFLASERAFSTAAFSAVVDSSCCFFTERSQSSSWRCTVWGGGGGEEVGRFVSSTSLQKLVGGVLHTYSQLSLQFLHLLCSL